MKDFNMMTWGFPCTDISVAGKQKGFLDENGNKTRSGLYYEGIRILRYKKPSFSIIENVKNLTGKKFKREFEMVLSDLDEVGYNSYYKVLNAKNYGIPQNRERVFIISIRKDLDNGKFKFPEPFDNGIKLKDILEDEVDEKFYLSDDKVQKFLSNFNQSELPVTTRNSDTVSTIRATYYKNGERNVCKNIENGNGYEDVVESNNPKYLGNVNNPKFGTGYAGGVWDYNNISPTLTTMQGGGRQPHIVCGIDKSNNHPSLIDNANCITSREDRGISNRKKEGTAVLECPETSYCLDANYYKGTSPEEYVKKHRRQLVFEENTIKMPQATKQGYIECEVGGVADLSYPNSKTRRGRVQEGEKISPTITATETGICKIEIADGCYVNQSKSFTRAPLKGLSRTLKANNHDAGLYDGIRIRKLTPKECFRLMGFSDQDFDAAQNAGISKSQLYKQAGNSIVVDVLYYIYVELYKAMPYLFDDLKLSSFFSGVGAFESSLDLLYQRIINFDRSELNIKNCEICGSDLRVKHNKTTNMYLCEKHCKQIYAYGKITNSSSYNQNDKNEIRTYEDYAILVLKNKYGEIVGESIVDIDDVDIISQYKWSLGNHGYVTSGAGKNQILLHRLLSNAPDDVYVDHINRNKLDNRKSNYRFCTNQENNRNKGLYSHNTSGITGVTWNKERNKWQAQIVVNNQNINLGRFLSFGDAVKARLRAEEKYFKDFTPQNRSGLYEGINSGNFIIPQEE